MTTPEVWTEQVAFYNYRVIPPTLTQHSDGSASWTQTRVHVSVVRYPRRRSFDDLIVAEPDREAVLNVVEHLKRWDVVTVRLWRVPEFDVLALVDIEYYGRPAMNWDGPLEP